MTTKIVGRQYKGKSEREEHGHQSCSGGDSRVVLIEEFSGHLTKDEEQLQFILQVVQAHRRAYPDSLKRTLQH